MSLLWVHFGGESRTRAISTQISPKQISSTGILDREIITLGIKHIYGHGLHANIKHRNPAGRHPQLKNLPPGVLANRLLPEFYNLIRRPVQKLKWTSSTLKMFLQRFIIHFWHMVIAHTKVMGGEFCNRSKVSFLVENCEIRCPGTILKKSCSLSWNTLFLVKMF